MMHVEQAAINGLEWFIGTAVFLMCWLVFLVLGGTLARILGGKESGDDDE